MINIKQTLEITKEDTVLRYSEGDNVICVTVEGKIFIGTIDLIGQCEDKLAIRIDTSDINKPYQYSCSVIFIDDIEYMVEDNDTNKGIVINLLWEQCKEKFINSFAELGFDMERIESLYDKVKNIAHVNNAAMADLVKCLVYSVENYKGFKEYLLGIE